MRLGLFSLSFLVGVLLPQSANSPHLDVRECVEIVADYSIRHIDVPDQTTFYGVTDPDARTIWIVDQADLRERREVAIHELLHAALRLRGDAQAMDEEG